VQVSRLVRSLKIGVPAEQQAERGDGTFCDTTLVGFIFAASLFGFFFTVYFLGDILVAVACAHKLQCASALSRLPLNSGVAVRQGERAADPFQPPNLNCGGTVSVCVCLTQRNIGIWPISSSCQSARLSRTTLIDDRDSSAVTRQPGMSHWPRGSKTAANSCRQPWLMGRTP